jgi:predicted ATPase
LACFMHRRGQFGGGDLIKKLNMAPITRKGVTVPLEVINECGYMEQSDNLRETSKLYGRSSEVKILHDAFQRIHCGHSEVVLVRGLPGIGKTKLVEKSLQRYVDDEGRGGFMVTGRYDSLHNEPFSAIRSALSDLVGHIIKSSRRTVTQNAVMEKFSEREILELIHFIPNLALLAGSEMKKQKEIVCATHASKRFIILLRSLIQTLVKSCPVALFLDDFQWIDEDSLLLLNALVQDSTSRNMLLICSTTEIVASEKSFPGSHARIQTTELTVGAMTREAVTELISDVFQIDEPELLCEDIMSKTSGNILKIANVLSIIQKDERLALASKGLVYALREEQENLLSSDSSDELLDWKIRQMRSDVHDILKIASCLGQEFHFDLLVHVCRSKNDESWDDNALRINAALDDVVHLGYLKKSAESYSFANDCIRQCWYSMIQQDQDASTIHIEIGMAVRSHMIIEQNFSLLFLAASNVKRGKSCTDNRLLEKQMLELLYEASQRAVGYGAFFQAKSFAGAALALLKNEQLHWERLYNLSMKVYCANIAIEMSLGNFEKAYLMAGELLVHSCSFDDSINALRLMIESLGGSGKYMEALQLGVLVLCDLGEAIPKSNVLLLLHLRREHIRIRHAMQHMSDEAVLSLPFMRCKRIIAVMQILGSLMPSAYLIQKSKSDATRFCLLGLRMMAFSLSYGLFETSCLGFACYGIVKLVTGNSHDAGRYGRLALQLVSKLGAEKKEAMVMYILLEHVMHSQQSWIECREALSHTYPKALTTGDLDCAFQHANCLILTASFSDAPLTHVENEIAGYCKLMNEYGHDATFYMSVSSWQRTHNYLGYTTDPIVLTGAVMEESTTVSLLKKGGNDAALQALNMAKLGLALFFESWDVAASLIPTIQKNMVRTKLGNMSQYECYFVLATSCMALYRETRRRRYRIAALRATKRLTKWKAGGVEVCAPMVTFLKAEWALAHGIDTVPSLFLEAVDGFASLKCLLNFQALAYERIGCHYLARHEHDRAAHFYSISISKYEDWEAMAKVNRLRASVGGSLSERKVTKNSKNVRLVERTTSMSQSHDESCGCVSIDEKSTSESCRNMDMASLATDETPD